MPIVAYIVSAGDQIAEGLGLHRVSLALGILESDHTFGGGVGDDVKDMESEDKADGDD